MSKCYAYTAYGANTNNTPGQQLQPNGVTYPAWIRANTLESKLVTIEGGYYNGCLGYFLFADGISTGSLSALAHTFSEDPTNPNCPPPTKYDCINGQCIIKTQYNTLGLYESLEDCQVVCANGGACAEGKQCIDPLTFVPSGKVCIDQNEFASIEVLINKIGSEVC